MKVMYLDESGEHRLSSINDKYPVFVLGGVIADRAYVREVIDPAFQAFNRRFFGTEEVVLHTVDIRKNAGVFAALGDPGFRREFFEHLNALIDSLDVQIVATVVDKHRYRETHGTTAQDPYLHCMESPVDHFCLVLGEARDSGFICAERRNVTLDRELTEAWEALRTGDAVRGYRRARHIEERIVGFEIRGKHPARAAMHLADLVVTPIGRYAAGKPQAENRIRWDVVAPKIQRINDVSGLILRP